MATLCPNCERITQPPAVCYCGVSQTQVLKDGRPCWLVHASEPFRGSTQSYLLPSGTVAYSGGQSFEDYNAERGGQFKLITDGQLDALLADFHGSMITDPEPITAEQFDDALNCLPPCRWGKVRGVELFHVSERITGDLVDWYARLNGRHWHFVDHDRQTGERLAEKVAVAAGLVAS